MTAINLANPVNRNDPINRGLKTWWYALPSHNAKSRFIDLCGSNHGALSGGALWTGPYLNAFGSIKTDGTDDHVSLGVTIPSLCVTAGTVSWWTKPNGTGTNQTLLGLTTDSDDAGDGLEFGSQVYGGTIYFGFNKAGGDNRATVTATGNLTTDWQQFTIAFTSGSNTYAYRNGLLIATFSGSTTILAMTKITTLGRRLWSGSAWFNGRYNDFRVYDRQQSDNEIYRAYRQSVLGYPRALNRIRTVSVRPPAAAGGDALTSKNLIHSQAVQTASFY